MSVPGVGERGVKSDNRTVWMTGWRVEERNSCIHLVSNPIPVGQNVQ